jgi:hypothetical protein
MVFLTGILTPILIWVGLIIVIREPLLGVIKQAGVTTLVFLTGVLTPILIWVGLIAALKELGEEYRLKRSPSRTIDEVFGMAGLSVQRVEIPMESRERNAIFNPQPMSEVLGIFTQAGL